jgi:hypothetical protein
LALYLSRLAFLVSVEADRPGALFPGALGLYVAWFPGINLSRDFERVKVPGNPMKSPFCFWCLLGQILAITICARRQPSHVKHLPSGLYNLPNENFHSLGSPPGDPRVARCSHSSVRILPPISFFFSLTKISARGPQGRSDTALRPDSRFWAPYAA